MEKSVLDSAAGTMNVSMIVTWRGAKWGILEYIKAPF
jgi:hypothetical protein